MRISRIAFVPALSLAAMATSLGAKPQPVQVTIRAVTHDKHVNEYTSTYATPGTSNTNCGGMATTTGNTTVGSANCQTTSTPAQVHQITRYTVDVTDIVEANGNRYTIACRANWVGSNCAPMTDGDTFPAQIDGTTMWVTGRQGGNQGKEVKTKYRILDIRSIAQNVIPAAASLIPVRPAGALNSAVPPLAAKQATSTVPTTQGSSTAGEGPGYWTEPGAGLMWTIRDNGADLSWKDAVSYCQKLSLGGYQDWWLPAITDLARVYDATEKDHVKGGIHVSRPSVWSISQPENEHAGKDAFWHGATYGIYRTETRSESLFFGDGTQHSDKPESRNDFRALCVRWTESGANGPPSQTSMPTTQIVVPEQAPTQSPNPTAPGKTMVTHAPLSTVKPATESLSNETIIKLSKAGLGDAVIVSMINIQPGQYTVTPSAVIALKEAGVSDAVILAMVSSSVARTGDR